MNCPFCGGLKLAFEVVEGQGEPYPETDKACVKCGDCGARGPLVETPHVWGQRPKKRHRLTAAAKWRERV